MATNLENTGPHVRVRSCMKGRENARRRNLRNGKTSNETEIRTFEGKGKGEKIGKRTETKIVVSAPSEEWQISN